MKRTLRILSLVLVAALLLGVCSFAGASEAPKKVELVFVCPGASPFEDLPDNALVLAEIQKRYLEDRNVDLNIIIKDCSWTGYEQLMQVEMASGIQIDMFPAWSSMAESFISNEMVYSIDEVLQEHGQNILKVVPELAWRWMTVDGKTYGLPRLRSLQDVHYTLIRKDWLDECGLAVPTTWEEYENALYAIRDLDPVGGGQTICVNSRVETALMASPVDMSANQMTQYFLAEDGKAYHYSQNPALKDALDRAAKWLEDGIINKDAFTVTRDEEEARKNQHKVATVNLTVSGIMNLYKTLKDVDPEGEYAVLPGSVWTEGYELSKAASDFLLVPANSKNLVELISFFDWMLEDKENFMLVRYGFEGVHYEYVNDGKQIDLIENENGGYNYTGCLNGTFDMYGLEGYGSDAVVDFVVNNFADPVMQSIYENEYQELLAQMKEVRATATAPDMFGFTYKLDGIASQTHDSRSSQFTTACAEYVTGKCDWSKVETAIKNFQEGLGGPEEFEQVNNQYQAWCETFNCK